MKIIFSALLASLVSSAAIAIADESLTPEQYGEMRDNVEVPDLVAKIGKLHVSLGAINHFKCSGTFVSDDGLFISGAHCLWNNEENARYYVISSDYNLYELDLLESFLPPLPELQDQVASCVSNGSSPEHCLTLVGQT